MTDKFKKTAHAWIAEIDADELAVRLMERYWGIKRPAGTAKEALDEAIKHDESAASTFKTNARSFRACAHVAIVYFQECIEGGQRLS